MKFNKILLTILLLIIILVPRIAGLKSFVTLDEPFWLTSGGANYYDISHGNLQNTVYLYHPAVTTIWIATGAFLFYFPQFRSLEIKIDNRTFDGIMGEHGKSPLELLYISRLLQLLVLATAAMIIFHLLSKMIGNEQAFLFTAFISSAPYFLGHSRVLNHEGMVVVFSLISYMGLMIHLERERKIIPLLLSAAAAGLAQLSKSSAMAIMPVIVLILIISVFEKKKEHGFGRTLIEHLKIFGIWLSGVILVYVIVWPGMWVAPGKMLHEVYGNAFSYAFQGSSLGIAREFTLSQFSLDAVTGSIKNFSFDLLWRLTPLTWLGVGLAIVFLFERGELTGIHRKLIAILLINAVAFIVFFSVAQGRDSLHYVMSSFVSMDGIAALGWAMSLGWLRTKWKMLDRLVLRATVVGVIILSQLGSALVFYPYYYTYTNPILGEEFLSDYGEGFEQAAAYLAQKPNAESLKVFSFRGRGPFSYFFPGETIVLNPLFMEEPGMGSMVERLMQADYLVFNDAMALRSAGTAKFVEALDGIKFEKSISIRGVYTIYIYRVADLPPSFYNMIKN